MLTERQTSYEEEVTFDQDIASMLSKKLFGSFPLNPGNNISQKSDESNFVLNGVLTEIFFGNDQLEPDVLDRIVKVLHDSYKDGYIPITDHFSFFITLIARFRVVRGDLAIESNEGRDTTFKALTDCVLIFVTNGVLYTLDSKPTRLSDSSLTTLSEFLPVYLIDIVNCIPEDKDKPSDLRLQPCFYYLVPCFFLFDRVGILSYEKLCGGNTRHRTRARKRSLRNDRTRVPFGRYIATEHPFRSVATQRPNACSARSLCSQAWLHSDRAWLHSDRASVPLGRYVATELEPSPVAT
uniref:Uncharacterized protein n=1 Tax=Brassica oleracea var. oleracea TaxID=109376 RepID=A0A0D3CG23_BRAOL